MSRGSWHTCRIMLGPYSWTVTPGQDPVPAFSAGLGVPGDGLQVRTDWDAQHPIQGEPDAWTAQVPIIVRDPSELRQVKTGSKASVQLWREAPDQYDTTPYLGGPGTKTVSRRPFVQVVARVSDQNAVQLSANRWRVTVTLTDRLADLAELTTGGSDWPAETIAARVARVLQGAGVAVPGDYLYGSVAARAASPTSSLAMLQDLLAQSYSPPGPTPAIRFLVSNVARPVAYDVARTNHVYDPSARDGDVEPWTAVGTVCAVSAVTRGGFPCIQAYAVQSASDAIGAQTDTAGLNPRPAGTVVSIQAVCQKSGAQPATVKIRGYAADGTVALGAATSANGAVPVDGQWYRVWLTAPVLPGKTLSRIQVYTDGGVSANSALYIRDVMVEDGGVVGEFFDGDTPAPAGSADSAYAWQGTPYQSVSEYRERVRFTYGTDLDAAFPYAIGLSYKPALAGSVAAGIRNLPGQLVRTASGQVTVVVDPGPEDVVVPAAGVVFGPDWSRARPDRVDRVTVTTGDKSQVVRQLPNAVPVEYRIQTDLTGASEPGYLADTLLPELQADAWGLAKIRVLELPVTVRPGWLVADSSRDGTRQLLVLSGMQAGSNPSGMTWWAGRVVNAALTMRQGRWSLELDVSGTTASPYRLTKAQADADGEPYITPRSLKTDNGSLPAGVPSDVSTVRPMDLDPKLTPLDLRIVRRLGA